MHEPAWPIETARLLLRPFLPSDLDALHAIHGDGANARWLYNGALSLAETRELLTRKSAGSVRKSRGASAVTFTAAKPNSRCGDAAT